jgi:hypothetical protein
MRTRRATQTRGLARALLTRACATLAACGAAAGGAAACGHSEARVESPRATDLQVSVRTGALEAPDTVAAGWSRLRVQEDGEGHIVVLFKLAGNATDADVPAFLAALDGSATTPPPAVALGGPEIGDSGEVIVELTPGRYVLGCVARGDDKHRHATTGEAKLVVVTGRRELAGGARDGARGGARGGAARPVMTQAVRMVDFAYPGPDRWAAGSHVLGVSNEGPQDHQLRLARLRPGSTVGDWMKAEDPGEHATDVAGVARLGAGAVAYLPVELPAGDYVAYCVIPDARSGRPHVELGMFRAIHVE